MANQFFKGDFIKGRPCEKWTQKRLQQEADALEKWSKLPSSLTLNGFSINRPDPYTKQQMYELAEKHKPLSDSIMRARQRIADRREKGGLHGTLDSSIVRSCMAFYDPEMRDHILEMKRKEAEAAASAFSAEEIKKAFKKASSKDAD